MERLQKYQNIAKEDRLCIGVPQQQFVMIVLRMINTAKK